MSGTSSSPLMKPKFVALDSSHLGAVAADKATNDRTRRRRAEAFEKAFDESGSVLLLCWHHLHVGSGLVTNLARPGGNITGFQNFEPAMGGKWLELLKEIAPSLRRVGVIYNQNIPANVDLLRNAEAASALMGMTVTATEWRRQDGHDETQKPDHSASLGDSVTSSIRIGFSVHTGSRSFKT